MFIFSDAICFGLPRLGRFWIEVVGEADDALPAPPPQPGGERIFRLGPLMIIWTPRRALPPRPLL
jgi:hypothetical protein